MLYLDAVLDIDSQPLFNGTTEATVKWLEENPSTKPRWVFISKTLDVITDSEYLDLAS